jgi:hypothetical protein
MVLLVRLSCSLSTVSGECRPSIRNILFSFLHSLKVRLLRTKTPTCFFSRTVCRAKLFFVCFKNLIGLLTIKIIYFIPEFSLLLDNELTWGFLCSEREMDISLPLRPYLPHHGSHLFPSAPIMTTSGASLAASSGFFYNVKKVFFFYLFFLKPCIVTVLVWYTYGTVQLCVLSERSLIILLIYLSSNLLRLEAVLWIRIGIILVTWIRIRIRIRIK